MKVAAVVILYHPRKDAISNIQTYYDWVDKIFVFDNSETKSAIHDDLIKLSKIELYHDFNNEGIAKRLNQACEFAIKEQFDWLLTMDQDSMFVENVIRSYFNCFHRYEHQEDVAMFGTNRSREIRSNTASCLTEEIDELITSGSLLNISLFKKIGSFDEELFIDLVDNEYCMRARMSGFSIIQFSNIYLAHQLGTEVVNSSIKSLFLIKKKKEVHSPLRCYYMYRNMLYIQKKYRDKNKEFTDKLRRDVIARLKINILYGRKTREIFKYLKIAKDDFKNNKMGKFESSFP